MLADRPKAFRMRDNTAAKAAAALLCVALMICVSADYGGIEHPSRLKGPTISLLSV